MRHAVTTVRRLQGSHRGSLLPMLHRLPLLLIACGPGPTPSHPPEPVRNAAPTISNLTLDLGVARDGLDPSCAATLHDPNSDRLTTDWSWSANSRATPHQGPSFPRAQLPHGGQLACTLTISDGEHTVSATAERSIPPLPPNVLLVVVDDLGLDKVGVYEAHPEPPRTPNIDALAARGVRFDRAYSHTVCSPSRAAMLTGRYASRTGVGWWIDLKGGRWSLPEDELTIPEVLQQSPVHLWSSAAFGKWHLVTATAHQPEEHPRRQGFDHFTGTLGNPKMSLLDDGIVDAFRGYYHWERWRDGERSVSSTYMTTQLVDDALEQLPALTEPWFALLSFHAAHSPYHVPPPRLHQGPAWQDQIPDRFDAAVEALDTELGRLFDTLDPDLLARTTLLFTSDNGTPGPAIRPPLDPLRKKGTTFDGGIRIPLIAAGPFVREPGRSSNIPVHLVDLLPTIADLGGVELADLELEGADGALHPLAVDGTSLLPVLMGPSGTLDRDTLYTERVHNFGPPPWAERRQVVVAPPYKLERWPEGTLALYDDRTDPLDEGVDILGSNSLTSEDAAALGQLEAALDGWDATVRWEWWRP